MLIVQILMRIHVPIMLMTQVMITIQAAEERDWPESGGQPICLPCDKIRCLDELEKDDCPEGTILEQNKMLGCCAACVNKRKFMETCFWDTPDHPLQKYDLEWVE